MKNIAKILILRHIAKFLRVFLALLLSKRVIFWYMSIVCARFSDKQLNVICTIYGKGYGKNAVASYS